MKQSTALWKSRWLARDILRLQERLIANPYDAAIPHQIHVKKTQARKYILNYRLSFAGDLKKIFKHDEQKEILRKRSAGTDDSYQLKF